MLFLDAEAVAVGALLASMVEMTWMTVVEPLGDLAWLCAGWLIVLFSETAYH